MYDLLEPSNTGIDFEAAQDFGNLASMIDIYTPSHQPDIHQADIILIGLPDDRNAIANEGTAHAPDQIRKALFKLFPGDWQLNLQDLGNLKIVGDINHTYQNLLEILQFMPSDTPIIILGGSQDSTSVLTNFLDLSNKTYNLSVIDAFIDSSFTDEELDNENYISQILTNDNGKLENLNIFGLQTYYNHPSKFKIFDQLYIDYYKLGEMQDNIIAFEPEFRESHIVSIDVRSIRQSDMPAQVESHPNGFTGLDICKLTRMSGIAVKNKYLGIYEYNPLYDKNNTGANLIAQMIWYYIDGKNDFKEDYPFIDKKDLLKFHVTNDMMDFIFYKNPVTNRWWVSFPDLTDKDHLFSCDENDYHQALKSIFSARIYRIINKITM